jgi:2-dehydropantoate 2-reductase
MFLPGSKTVAQHTPAQPALNWTIVGQGAIGSLAASRLALAGTTVSLWLRQPTTTTIQFQHHALHFSPAAAPLNAIVVPVKSHAVMDAIHTLLPVLTTNAQLVLSHNGMGTIEQVLPLLGPAQGLWFLTTTHAALKQGETLLHTGQGQSVLAPLNVAAWGQRLAVQAAMESAFGPLTVTDDIQPYLWQKLAINAVINPLTALHNCRNGALSAASFQPQIQALVLEVCQVAAAAGINLPYQQTMSKVQQVIISTAENYSSMQQDVLHQRCTEISAINGFIVQQAARYQLPVPLNQRLLQQVLQLQQGYGR